MTSKDLKVTELKENLKKSLDSQNTDDFCNAIADFAEVLQSDIMKDFQNYQKTQDHEILAKRGIRMLTSEETKFYEGMKKSYTAKTFEGLENAFPETILEAVMENIKTQFPLLNAIQVMNTATMTKILVNKTGMQYAKWGALGSKITEELEGSIGVINLTDKKLTAFLPVSKDMLDAGIQWIDAYVRAVLAEASGAALCKEVITGNGKEGPIGMMKDLTNVSSEEYQDKSATSVTKFDPVTYGGLLSKLAEDENKRQRVVDNLIMVVNPVDYFGKVMPATTWLLSSGIYARDVLPYPTQIIQDVNVPSGKAVLGLAKRYFMGVGKGGSGGRIDYDDSFRFLDDERVYKTKMYGDGRPLDNNAFLVLDISGLTPLVPVVETKTGAAAASAMAKSTGK
ncbi:MAG: phage major capsid protein [Massiliimalia sp.]|jgi:hypothetical protein